MDNTLMVEMIANLVLQGLNQWMIIAFAQIARMVLIPLAML